MGYLTFTAQEDNSTIQLWLAGQHLDKSNNKYVKVKWKGDYSIDGGAWIEYTPASTGDSYSTEPIILNSGHSIRFRGIIQSRPYIDSYLHFVMSGKFSAEGNIMSLIRSIGYNNAYELTYNYALTKLFMGCASLTDVSNLELPALDLTEGCYYKMFAGCFNLTNAPELPATSLKENCYQGMFTDCVKLEIAPELPSTALKEHCYDSMFFNCGSLNSAPDLPAENLQISCYANMFTMCSSLTDAPIISAKTIKSKSCEYMFAGCTALTKVPNLEPTNLANCCYMSMFQGCTSLQVNNAPVVGVAEQIWKIPKDSETTQSVNLTMLNMFLNCLGARITDSPSFGEDQFIYYTQNIPV